MSFSLPDGFLHATVIVQFDNGYMVQKLTPDALQSCEVFTEDQLEQLAYAVFEGQTRGKRKGGLEIRVADSGTEEEKEYHDEKESTFFELNKPVHIYLTPDRKVTVVKNPANKRGLQILEAK